MKIEDMNEYDVAMVDAVSISMGLLGHTLEAFSRAMERAGLSKKQAGEAAYRLSAVHKQLKQPTIDENELRKASQEFIEACQSPKTSPEFTKEFREAFDASLNVWLAGMGFVPNQKEEA